MSNVKRVAAWTGWCDPCETERPLVLTETGERGIRAWLRGIGAEDRSLTLTCLVCGEWQEVPFDEADVADVVAVTASPVTAVRRLGARQVIVRSAPLTPYPSEPVPTPRAESDVTAATPADATLELLADGLDLMAAATA